MKLLSFVLLLLLSACGVGTTGAHPYAGELEKAEGYDEEVPFDFKLPTSLPFELDEIFIMEMGEDEIEIVSSDRYMFDVILRGEDREEEHLIVMIHNHLSVENTQGQNEEQLTLSGGEDAKYFYNGASQILSWDDDDLMYQIAVSARDGEKYSIEELVEIAESFETY
ncbi:hypothetical protein J2R98_001181 [Alkalibacillus filiformis]|uniref:DUF4367 domain-containing protein n=1 Tax=Alkalibacillus filiformis TaxID=200990 RepID=A0ABU0DSE6_9BACI|nr:hypothetical protein [Alkalibacillus filiformis]MDQ0351367.1 hypothetical protein [Alkalibacillus filiformis]